jgi:hypothetical protein
MFFDRSRLDEVFPLIRMTACSSRTTLAGFAIGVSTGSVCRWITFWTDSQDLLKIREDKVAPIDRAIQLGEKYGIHINLGLHRAPGYCILDTMDEALTGIHVTKEKSSVFTDPKMLDAFVYSGPISPAATKEYPAKNSASIW